VLAITSQSLILLCYGEARNRIRLSDVETQDEKRGYFSGNGQWVLRYETGPADYLKNDEA